MAEGHDEKAETFVLANGTIRRAVGFLLFIYFFGIRLRRRKKVPKKLEKAKTRNSCESLVAESACGRSDSDGREGRVRMCKGRRAKRRRASGARRRSYPQCDQREPGDSDGARAERTPNKSVATIGDARSEAADTRRNGERRPQHRSTRTLERTRDQRAKSHKAAADKKGRASRDYRSPEAASAVWRRDQRERGRGEGAGTPRRARSPGGDPGDG